MEGKWSKKSSAGRTAELAFQADLTANGLLWCLPRRPPTVAAERFAGRFDVRFSDSGDPAVAVFEAHPGGWVNGTILTATGDYRYMKGPIEDDTLRLSPSTARTRSLFTATAPKSNGTLRGDFWSGDRSTRRGPRRDE